MTVVTAWVRKIRDCEELVFASDSRLSGDGRNFDACPKILRLRRDCAIAFAGYSGHAFPMMLQLALAIGSYAPAQRGSLDISTLRTHALKVFDGMSKMIQSSPKSSVPQEVNPEASFLLGGYSWEKKSFELWTVVFSAAEHRFVAHPAGWIGYHDEAHKFLHTTVAFPTGTGFYSKIAFAGDQAQKCRDLLSSKLAAKNSTGETFQGLDWEPFEVVRDMLRDPNHSETIGGAPQIVKVYQYMLTAPFGVYWPNKVEQKVFLQGRPCLGYEHIDRWILDPDTLISENPHYSKSEEQFLGAVDGSAGSGNQQIKSEEELREDGGY